MTVNCVVWLQWWAGYTFFIDGIFLIFAITFYQRVIWTWNLFFLKEHHLGDILNTHVIVVWPTEKILERSEKKFYLQKQRFSHIFMYEWTSQMMLFSTHISLSQGVSNWKNEQLLTFVAIKIDLRIVWPPRLIWRIHGPKEVLKSIFWILKSIQNLFRALQVGLSGLSKSFFLHAISADFL